MTSSGPPTDQPEPDRPDDAFIAEMLKEHPEVRPYLPDDYADVVDGPIEHAPEDVVIHDRGGRQVIVSRTTTTTGTGVIVVRSARVPSDRDRVVAALDAANAINLADAIGWAARLATH